MKRAFAATVAAIGGLGLLAADVASAQTLGGFPIREPGSGSHRPGPGPGNRPDPKGPMQIIVDANGPGPYRSIAKAVDDV
ncbi:MAG: hypothetical protein RIE56_06220, partial [Amphiplicatus sp.]